MATKGSKKPARASKRTKVVKKKSGRVPKKPASRKTKTPKLPITKPYSQRELQHFKEIILEKKKETVEELENLKESMMDVTTGEYVSESSTYSMHMEQGTDAMEREKTFLFASRGNKFVNQLDDALQRIENGTYGICRVCQLLIPKERLEAVPTAQTCAEYKNTGQPCARGRIALAKMKKL
jgi:RNA polymerase-binding protein DksA